MGTHGDDHIVRLVLSKRGQVSEDAGTAQGSSAGCADAERRRFCGRPGGESVEEHDVLTSEIVWSCFLCMLANVQIASCGSEKHDFRDQE